MKSHRAAVRPRRSGAAGVSTAGTVGAGLVCSCPSGRGISAGATIAHPMRTGLATSRTTVVLGYSVDRRPIVGWLIAPPRARSSVLVVGSIAGDEPGGIEITKLLAAEAAIARVRLWLVPDLNPDGAAKATRDNADGVDLNRNFPFHWRRLGQVGDRYYSGELPSSEPEARAFERFILRTRPGLTIWLHQPYGLIDDSEGP